ncbi:MAG: hypothetical protein LBT00_09565, partial [Spirochaetaceae bacterium]|nr:hypothetical protein [Spirochaetaceae bacterium]
MAADFHGLYPARSVLIRVANGAICGLFFACFKFSMFFTFFALFSCLIKAKRQLNALIEGTRLFHTVRFWNSPIY